MNSFRTLPAPSATATPQCVQQVACDWQKAAYEALNVMSSGGNPAQVDSTLVKMPDESPMSVFDLLHVVTMLFTGSASHRYEWFKSLLFLEARNCVELWCAGNRGPESLLRARSLVKVAEAEFVRVTMTVRKEIASEKSAVFSEVIRPNAERNKWLFDQYVNCPRKTLKQIIGEAKTTGGWILGNVTALRKGVRSHCRSLGIDMPRRNDKRTKPK